jgi:hypothetical protein
MTRVDDNRIAKAALIAATGLNRCLGGEFTSVPRVTDSDVRAVAVDNLRVRAHRSRRDRVSDSPRCDGSRTVTPACDE